MLPSSEERLLREGAAPGQAPLERRRLLSEAAVTLVFLLAAGAVVVVDPPSGGWIDHQVLALVGCYLVARRIRYAVGAGHSDVTQVFLIPLLLLVPVSVVPLVVLAAGLANGAIDVALRRSHPSRVVFVGGDAWHVMGPVLVLLVLSPGAVGMEDLPVLALAVAAQLLVDSLAGALSEWTGRGVRPGMLLPTLGTITLVDALLSFVGFLAAVASLHEPYAFALLLPSLGLLSAFSRERTGRLDAALALADSERAAARDRERVLGAASHEMQTPLAVILGLLRTLERSPDAFAGERRAEALSTMRREAVRLRALVRQSLLYGRMVAGQPLASPEARVDVRARAQEVADAFAQRARVDVVGGVGAHARSDADALHQLLMLLVDDALRRAAGARIETVTTEDDLVVRVEPAGRPVGVPDDLPGLDVGPAVVDALGAALGTLQRDEAGGSAVLVLPAAAPAAADRPVVGSA